ncbi:MAG: DUF4160 domain-containing protein [Acidobacteria bacterium]|nr:DUF4160 domain-containing protein [Acidobacteriota bacterium]
MPVISTFFGIVVTMYFFDNRRHSVPHIHVKAEGEEAVISIPDGEVLQGFLRPNKLRLTQAWVEIHRKELMECWELAVIGKPIFRIEPLR